MSAAQRRKRKRANLRSRIGTNPASVRKMRRTMRIAERAYRKHKAAA